MKRAAAFKPRRIKIKVIGIGGGGSSIVCEMARSMKGVSFAAVDTDSRVFRIAGGRSGVRVFQFGQKTLGGRGSGMNWDLAKKAAEEEKEKIAKLFAGADFVVLVGCLGGGVASGAGPVFAQLAAGSPGTIPIGIFTLPFAFEGEKKMQVAKKAAEQIKEELSGIVVISNERIFSIIDKKTPLSEALSTLNLMFVEWLNGLIEVIARPGLINIDFADVRSILRGKGEVIYFSQVEAGGPNRAEEIIQKMFKNPIFEIDNLRAKRILFNIKGGRDLTLNQIAQISEKVSQLNSKAKIIFGIVSEPAYKNKIKLTVLALGSEELPAKAGGKKRAKPKKPAKPKPQPQPQQKPGTALKQQLKQSAAVKKVKDRALRQGLQASPSRITKGRSAKNKKARRSAIEIKKEEEKNNHQEWHNGEEGEWQLPAYLRIKN